DTLFPPRETTFLPACYTAEKSHFCTHNPSWMKMPVYQSLLERKQSGQRSFALLIDPDKVSTNTLDELVRLAVEARTDYFLVGGSLVISDALDACIQAIRQRCSIPVVLFPGAPSQISRHADALLYLSLISGRNPELLIGQHVVSAPFVRRSGLEVISTGYMVIDGGAATTVSYISNATPIPADKADIALCTAMAGEMLGMKLIYMDAGSGAKRPITEDMIHTVARQVEVPLIIGGGIRDAEKAYRNCVAGANVIVVGNAIEKDPTLIREMAAAVHEASGRKVGVGN
ncbi:MAG TPA: geranylgeranylglyceryl/heptaprenylglyceryl phosphate synthase, partial [Chitinophagaceae bacterium]|nr:geranylgeranylglyceryl/heptaprenylglyceryl phosphate synthase [Chitinophagaceae bacterium]